MIDSFKISEPTPTTETVECRACCQYLDRKLRLNKKSSHIYSILVIVIISICIFQTTGAYAATQFYFHISNILLGEDVKFVITNTDTGHYQVHRTHIVPFLSDTVTINSVGGFPPGTNVKGCMTNFANGHTSCDRNVVEPGGVDFYVSAR